MLTARGDPVDRVLGLELGADDYVAKPFDARELVARVRAVWRRVAPAEPDLDAGSTRRVFGDAVLDLRARTLCVGERQVPLTTIEFRLLVELATHPGVALSRELLNKAAQVGNYRPLERAVDVQIARLRRKLRAIDPRGRLDRHRARRGLPVGAAAMKAEPARRSAGSTSSGAGRRSMPMFLRVFVAMVATFIVGAWVFGSNFGAYQDRATASTLAPLWAEAIRAATPPSAGERTRRKVQIEVEILGGEPPARAVELTNDGAHGGAGRAPWPSAASRCSRCGSTTPPIRR